jgi:hypothetical protein
VGIDVASEEMSRESSLDWIASAMVVTVCLFVCIILFESSCDVVDVMFVTVSSTVLIAQV